MDSIDAILQLPQRKLVIAKSDVMLDTPAKNEIFIMMVEESRGSAGGRAAGGGHRKIVKIYGFSCENGCSSRTFESDDQQKIEQFDIPYSAVAMDIKLSSGQPYVVQGVIDPDLIASYRAVVVAGNLK
jgi:hypothetical protein